MKERSSVVELGDDDDRTSSSIAAATLARQALDACPAHADSASIARESLQLETIMHSALYASIARKVSRPALLTSPAFFTSTGVMVSSSVSRLRPSDRNASWNIRIAFLEVSERSSSTAGTIASTKLCRLVVTTSRWCTTRRRASVTASYCATQSSSFRLALLALVSACTTLGKAVPALGSGCSCAVSSSSTMQRLFSIADAVTARRAPGSPSSPSGGGAICGRAAGRAAPRWLPNGVTAPSLLSRKPCPERFSAAGVAISSNEEFQRPCGRACSAAGKGSPSSVRSGGGRRPSPRPSLMLSPACALCTGRRCPCRDIFSLASALGMLRFIPDGVSGKSSCRLGEGSSVPGPQLRWNFCSPSLRPPGGAPGLMGCRSPWSEECALPCVGSHRLTPASSGALVLMPRRPAPRGGCPAPGGRTPSFAISALSAPGLAHSSRVLLESREELELPRLGRRSPMAGLPLPLLPPPSALYCSPPATRLGVTLADWLWPSELSTERPGVAPGRADSGGPPPDCGVSRLLAEGPWGADIGPATPPPPPPPPPGSRART
mmetsp:Transcript_16025/g.41620  ORF Transcript_16025/g.41620 Transcript_16025/m.41620 type:complete len:550 (-) Transcript_16025:881-2530(-)